MSPIVIAGGGPAGASAACRLAQAGRRVTLLEREIGPAHKICGEFISGEALADLSALGLDVSALGAAPIRAMRLVHRGRVAETRLPFPAAGLSRLALDEVLLDRAAACGAEVRRGVRVRQAAGGQVETSEGTLDAPILLLATGKHDLRGMPRLLRSPPEDLIGFKLHLHLRPSQQALLAGHVEIVLFRGGYAGLQMVEHGVANLCLLVDRSRYESDWPSLLAALEREDCHLARRLEGAVPAWDRPLTIFRVPYGFLHAAQDEPGLFRLGDQAAVIPSFCGDGMAIALHSAKLAAHAVLAGQSAAAYHTALRRDAGPPVRLAQRAYRLTRSRAIRSLIVTAAQSWPGLLRSAARHTRVAMP
jgi:flavin-dependent dehydrogenase